MTENLAAVSRVLVVDDDPDINRLLRVRLTTRGYQVDFASNGEDALVKLDEFRPDLAFLDVSMPGMGGIEVLQQIRCRSLDMAVIMMTAFGSEGVAIEALRQGADDYLRKPFEPKEFQAILERTVSRLELTRQNAALRRQLDEKRRQLEAELARAAAVQAALLPRVYPTLPGFELAASCLPAREVGGDFYDWLQPAPNSLTFTLGDVMGKGMPAALLMATIRATLRASSHTNAPVAAIGLAGVALEADFERSGSFATLFHGQLDVNTRTLRFVDAGHGHVFLRRADKTVEELSPRGLPFGISVTEAYGEGLLTLNVGDTLVIYSDGLIDARPDLRLDRLALASKLDGANGAEEMVRRLAELPALAGPPPDDLTILAIHCRGS